ncbi:helix-turn-helix transcriptional regulator [Achromobacter sp. JUb104]|uniref:helix-turn-helix transcriptional regulator n=1 Tax=Achromobacter sp. JUb104 TaxID=2940590 RepID=UPI002168726C|nr:helix-turn-helix domain-containing protein [Achromobacter sp. JUb104]MCS3507495.1 DNA-binding XRE family transcriptional regulator [Achromobacter sp. JUb104]
MSKIFHMPGAMYASYRDPLIETLRQTRKKLGLTQQALADQAGISRRALVAIEGGGDCSLSTLRRLMRVLNLELTLSPAEYRPPNLEDILQENEAGFGQSSSRPRA